MSGIALLSNVTLAGPFLTRNLKRLTHRPLIIPDGYDAWRQTLLDISRLSATPEAVFLVMDGTSYLGWDGLRDRSLAQNRIQEALQLIEGFLTAHQAIPLFVSDFDIPHGPIRAACQPNIARFAASLWREGIEAMQLPVLPLSDIAADVGRSRFYSATTWYAGSLPFSMEGEKALASAMGQMWNAYVNGRKKVLILDLDNTLWGGVIGEDGVGGIILSRNHEGAAFRDFQQRCLELKELGVLLAVVSKNNPEDALEAINTHPDMVLRKNDFVAIKANWDSKAVNIASLANALNLGLDSFVFVDDNPVERATVKEALPDVEVPEFPAQPAKLPIFAAELAHTFFPVLRLTRDDVDKTIQYRAEEQRKDAKLQFVDASTYLASLQMELTIHCATDMDIPRAAQLTQKTNQFNLTTHRYTEADIRRMVDSPDWRVWVGKLRDRFGDFGTIALCIAEIKGHTATIDTFLMSCRAMGRNVEHAFLSFIENSFFDEYVDAIHASYRKTIKNTVVKNFWPINDYAEIEDGSFFKKISERTVQPDAIKIIEP